MLKTDRNKNVIQWSLELLVHNNIFEEQKCYTVDLGIIGT